MWSPKMLQAFIAAWKAPVVIPCDSAHEARRRQNQFWAWRRDFRLYRSDYPRLNQIEMIVVQRKNSTLTLRRRSNLRTKIVEELAKQLKGR